MEPNLQVRPLIRLFWTGSTVRGGIVSPTLASQAVTWSSNQNATGLLTNSCNLHNFKKWNLTLQTRGFIQRHPTYSTIDLILGIIYHDYDIKTALPRKSWAKPNEAKQGREEGWDRAHTKTRPILLPCPAAPCHAWLDRLMHILIYSTRHLSGRASRVIFLTVFEKQLYLAHLSY